jgi:hypothetical protein
MVFLLLGELVPHNERVVGNKWNGLESVFEEPSVLGSPLSNCVNSKKVVIVSPEANVPLGVSNST